MNKMPGLVIVAISIVAGLLSGPIDAATGRTNGTFTVTATGAASYVIPLWTPPGIRSLRPQIAITYNSSLGDGLLGPGWTISGLSTISRCNKTFAQDGAPAPITLTTADKFCLDGNRLRSTSGTYGASGSTYQTEIANFSNVTASGTAGNGPAYFTVKGKDGLIYEYGNPTDAQGLLTNAQILPPGSSTPYIWALDKVSDRQGNYMTITYYQSGGAYVPLNIKFTAVSGSSSYPNQLTFVYSTRVTTDNLTQYIAGTQVKQTLLLSSVNLTSAGSSVRQYKLTYTASGTTFRPTLTKVEECGGSAGTDCLAATNIAYQAGQAGAVAPATATGSGATIAGTLKVVDIDGDGRDDLLFAKASGANYQWWVQFATATGYGLPISTGLTASTTANILTDDLLGDGKTELLGPNGALWYVYRWNGSTFVATSTGLAVDANLGYGQAGLADGDGDGRPDLWTAPAAVAGAFTLYVRRNTSSGGVVSFSGTASSLTTSSSMLPKIRGNNSFPGSSVQHVDLNGDGKEDILVGFYFPPSPPFPGGYSAFGYSLSGSTITFVGSFNGNLANYLPARWNDDACTDGIGDFGVTISPCGGQSTVSVGLSGAACLSLDWDGDGRSDALCNSGGVWQLYRSQSDSVAPVVSTGISVGSGQWVIADQNADGLADLYFANSASSNAISFGLHNGAGTPPDLISSITDGYGLQFSPLYASIGQSNYVKTNSAIPAAVFPEVDFVAPLYVVKSFTASTFASDGGSSSYTEAYSYEVARNHLQGRGFEGFGLRHATDGRTNLRHDTYYKQSFPYLGIIVRDDLIQPAPVSAYLSHIQKTLQTTTLDATANNQRYFPYVQQQVATEYQVGSTNSITQTTTTSTFDSYGNETLVKVDTTDNDSSSPFYTSIYKTQIGRHFDYTSASTNWCINIPDQTVIQSTLPDNSTLTRTNGLLASGVDYAACFVTTDYVEPATAQSVTTTYTHDTCGNVNSASVVGKDENGAAMTARLTQINYGSRCQLPESTTNALSQITNIVNQYDLGVVQSQTDPNGIQTSWTYDNFARKKHESRPDGTSTDWTYNACNGGNNYCGIGSSDVKWEILAIAKTTALTEITRQYQHFDGMDRLRESQSKTVTGALSSVRTTYDTLGRKAKQMVPFFTASNGAHKYSYDIVNRVTLDQVLTGAGSVDRQTIVTYTGRKVSITDPRTNQSSRIYDVWGNLRRVIDPSPGGTTSYSYDPLNNLVSLSDPPGNVSSQSVNVLGYVTQSSDPNMGVWNYKPNSLGEYKSQTDAKNQTVSLTYDALSRPIGRSEIEGTTTWTWGISAANHNIGRIASVTRPDGYAEVYAYDGFGRPSGVTYTLPGETPPSNAINYAYNASGLLDTLTYPTSTNSCRLVVKYGYAYGIKNALTNNSNATQCGATGTVYWTLNASDERGNPIDETLGTTTPVHVISGFDPLMGHMSYRTSGTSGGFTNLQNLSYIYDPNENLTDRIDVNQGNLTEHVIYDTLNRYSSSTVGTHAGSATYAANGNIASTADAGPYDYTTAQAGCGAGYAYTQPNAVRNAGGASYCYDANGNFKSSPQQSGSVSWYSYNLVNSISSAVPGGTSSSQFLYAPDRSRWKQIANYLTTTETTVYIGGLVEKETLGAITYWKHYIATPGAATVLYIRRSDGSQETDYTASDHLGSADTIFDSAGNLRIHLSYAPFGARRDANGWYGALHAADWAQITALTRRGFTSHEMIDNLSLVNMNGRIYSPTLGRFLSADPGIQSISSSQTVNRYSYVNNNPLTATDPSGFDLDPIYVDCCTPSDGGGFGDFGDYSGYYDPAAFALAQELSDSGLLNIGVPLASFPASVRGRQPATYADANGNPVHSGPIDAPNMDALASEIFRVGGESVVTIDPSVIKQQPDELSTIRILGVRIESSAWAQLIPFYGFTELLVFRSDPFSLKGLGAIAGATPVLGLEKLVAQGGTNLVRGAAAGLSPIVRGGASLDNIAVNEALRIQNAANRIGHSIALVGSRARGTATAVSDWDYVVNASARIRNSVSSSLPGAGNIAEGIPKSIDIFKGVVDEALPSITFFPVSP